MCVCLGRREGSSPRHILELASAHSSSPVWKCELLITEINGFSGYFQFHFKAPFFLTCCRHRWLNSILSSLDHDRIPESPAVFVLQEVTGTPFPVIVIFIHTSGRSIRFRQARIYVRISQPPCDHGHLVFLQKEFLIPTLLVALIRSGGRAL